MSGRRNRSSAKPRILSTPVSAWRTLEIIGGLVGEGVQHRIPRQSEDVVDTVRLAPRHGLGPAVMAVAPEGEPGARPVPADTAGQMLQKGADLDPRGRLAGAQENRHRPAALDVVDVDRGGSTGCRSGR